MTGDEQGEGPTDEDDQHKSSPQSGDRDANVIHRETLRAGAVECPLCHRQLVTPLEHGIIHGPEEKITVETVEAIACPVCDGVTFVVDE